MKVTDVKRPKPKVSKITIEFIPEEVVGIKLILGRTTTEEFNVECDKYNRKDIKNHERDMTYRLYEELDELMQKEEL